MTRRPRPLLVSGTLSVLSATAAILFVAGGPTQRLALGSCLVGLAGVALAARLARTGHRLLAGVVGLGGTGVVLFAMLWGVTRTAGTTARAEFFPAIPGLVLLVLGLASVRAGWERPFVTAGTATVLLAVFLSGLVYGAPADMLLAATAATVVAWDLGEQAINMGEHVGREARTWPVEVTHGAVSVVVGGVAVLAAMVVYGSGVKGLSLAGLSVLLGSAVVLTTALYN